MFFAPKSADIRIWRTPPCPQNVRTGQTLPLPWLGTSYVDGP